MYNQSNLPYSCSGNFTSVNNENVFNPKTFLSSLTTYQILPRALAFLSRFCHMKMNSEKNLVHVSMCHPAKNELSKSSKRPSVICSYPNPKKSTLDSSTAEDEKNDLSEDEVELTKEMLLDLKKSYNTIKDIFNNGDAIDQKTDRSVVVSLEETIVVNSANLETKGVSNDDAITNDVINDNCRNYDITHEDVTQISTQNTQSETNRTKTSQKRPSKSNIQFQVPKKLQVLQRLPN